MSTYPLCAVVHPQRSNVYCSLNSATGVMNACCCATAWKDICLLTGLNMSSRCSLFYKYKATCCSVRSSPMMLHVRFQAEVLICLRRSCVHLKPCRTYITLKTGILNQCVQSCCIQTSIHCCTKNVLVDNLLDCHNALLVLVNKVGIVSMPNTGIPF